MTEFQERTPASEAFVGRTSELEDLRRGLESALVGRGRLILLVGEPGIGKTRLADEVATDAEARGAQVLWGRCWESGGAPAYWPWSQIIRNYSVTSDSASDEAVEMLAPLRALVNLSGRSTPETVDPEQARFQLFDAAATFFREAATVRPLVLIIDDLHAADRASLLLLRFIAREVRSAPWLLLGTYREAEVARDPTLAALLAEIAREGQRLPLRGLSRNEIADYIREAAPLPRGDSVVQAVYEATDGNPFFVTEVVRLLAQERAPDASSARPRIPDEVRTAIRQRLSLLSDRALTLLQRAAVVGREIDIAILAALAPDHSHDDLLRIIDEAVQMRVLTPAAATVGRFSFVHLLIRDTLYDDLSTPDRLALHRRAADAMTQHYAGDLALHLAEIAHHYGCAAASGDVAPAVEYSRKAGERALASLAYEEAVLHFRRALSCLELRRRGADASEHCELLLQLSDAQWGTGDLLEARSSCASAAEIANTLPVTVRGPLLARAALGLGGRQQRAHVAFEQVVVEYLEEALSALGDSDSILRARVLARLAYAIYSQPGSLDRRRRLCGAAVDMARRLGDDETIRWVLNDWRWALWGPDTIEERLKIAGELVRLAEQRKDREMALGEHSWRLVDYLELGDIHAVDAELDIYARLAHEVRLPWYHWYVSRFRALRATIAGRFEEAERCAQDALDNKKRTPHQDAFLIYATQLMSIRFEQGRLEELEAGIQGLVAQYPTVPVWQYLLAYVHAEQGRETAARTELDRIAANDFADLPENYLRLANAAYLAEVATFLNDAPRAAQLYEILRPYEDRCIVIGFGVACLGACARPLGQLAATIGRWDDAARHFETALEVNQRLGALPALARTQLAYAAMLRRAQASTDAAQTRAATLLTEAAGTAARLGMKRLEQRIAELQRQPAIATPSQAVATPAGDSATFKQSGDYWEIQFGTDQLRLKDLRGLAYIAHLLRNPGREFHARQMVALFETHEASDRMATQQLIDLHEELTDAEAGNDLGRAAQLRARIDELGALWNTSSEAQVNERARISVTKRISIAMKRMSAHCPGLVRYLEATIKTGNFCGYRPDPARVVRWQL